MTLIIISAIITIGIELFCIYKIIESEMGIALFSGSIACIPSFYCLSQIEKLVKIDIWRSPGNTLLVIIWVLIGSWPMLVPVVVIVKAFISEIYYMISNGVKREKARKTQKREEKEQAEIQRERLLQEQATQNRISNVREKIKALNGYELNVVPFLYLLDKEGKRSEAFTQVADKYRDHAMKIKRDQERINREAESLGIPERARTAGR